MPASLIAICIHFRNSAVGCVMGYNFWAMGWMVLGSICDRGTGYFSSPNRSDLCWDPPNFLFPVAKRLGHEDDYSPPCIVGKKNVWNYTATPPSIRSCPAEWKFAFSPSLQVFINLIQTCAFLDHFLVLDGSWLSNILHISSEGYFPMDLLCFVPYEKRDRPVGS
jgi:hypothetical protein